MRQRSVSLRSPAALQAVNRRLGGTQIVVQGKHLWVTTSTLARHQREYIPDGTRNVGDADPRVFNATPADLPEPPTIGESLIWEGVAYTIVKVLPEISGGVSIALLLYAYRTPPAGHDKKEAAQIAKWPQPPD